MNTGMKYYGIALAVAVCALWYGGDAAGIIFVTQPGGGESWNVGDTVNLAWTTEGEGEGATGNVWLYNNWTKVRKLAVVSIPQGLGNYQWTIPQDEPAGYLYRLRLQSLTSGVSDYSGTFTINAPKTLQVVSPNGGESWDVAEQQLIKWTSTGLWGNARIYLYDHWTKLGLLATVPIQNGSWEWGPNDTLCGPLYRIRVQSVLDTSINDYSDNLFTLTTSLPQAISVFTPSGGSTLIQGGTGDVDWESVGLWGNARVYLYYNWTKLGVIGTVPVQQWNWTWNVPVDQTPGDAYRIRVQSLVNTAISGYSDKFTVIDGPDGGK